MRSAVIDTDVVSFSFKEDTRGSLYEQHLKNSINSISFMTVAELDYWAASHNWGDRRKAELATFLKQFAIWTLDFEVRDRTSHGTLGKCRNSR